MIGKKVELLAPAGSYDSLKAGVNAGADAVYMGGALFSARAYAENPDNQGLIKAVEYCHFYGRKIYLAVNTLLKQKEIETQLFDHMSAACEAGIDGVIVQDLGVMRFINEHFKGLPIHVSTQASVMTAEGARYLKELIPGITRVVPARELSLSELKRFHNETDLEMEVFVHGALCVCYSGMCLMSSYIGDRSGNRGRCAQPCRKMYDTLMPGSGSSLHEYLLSPKDQCLLDSIPELIETGIDSFKIEGRMKSPEYTAGTVAVYRKRIDECLGSSEIYSGASDRSILLDLYNRGGFNSGYLNQHNGPDMMSMVRPNHSGVLVGKVEKINGREAVIRLSEDVFAHDVLEIRREQAEKIFEFTTGEPINKNDCIKTLTMKESRAKIGDEVYRTRCETLLRNISEKYLKDQPKLPVEMFFTAHTGKCALLTVKAYDRDDKEDYEYENSDCIQVTVKGDIVSSAQKAPVTAENIRKQLEKLGDTQFEAIKTNVEADDNIFIPLSKINSIRREAAEELEKNIIEFNRPNKTYQFRDNKNVETKIEYRPDTEKSKKFTKLYAACWTIDQLKSIFSEGITECCYNISALDLEIIEKAVETAGNYHNLIIGLPYVCRYEEVEGLKNFIDKVLGKYPEIRFMIRNYDESGLIKKYFPEVFDKNRFETDYIPYCSNAVSQNNDAYRITLSEELDVNELKDLGSRFSENNLDTALIIYGYQPSMISAQCVYKNATGKCHIAQNTGYERTDKLDDTFEISSYGNSFKTRQLCTFCTNIIYNSDCLNNIDRIDELKEIDVKYYRLDFTFESPEEVKRVIRAAMEGLEGKTVPELSEQRKYTRGHLHRPVL